MYRALLHSFPHVERELVITPSGAYKEMFVMYEEEESMDPMVFLRDESSGEWSGLDAHSCPFLFMKHVDHTDIGALRWTLSGDRTLTYVVEQYVPWIDMTSCISCAGLEHTTKLEMRTYHTTRGEVHCKWRLNGVYIYDDNDVGAHTRHAVLDSMIRPLYA